MQKDADGEPMPRPNKSIIRLPASEAAQQQEDEGQDDEDEESVQ
jgi:hypothetical protein